MSKSNYWYEFSSELKDLIKELIRTYYEEFRECSEEELNQKCLEEGLDEEEIGEIKDQIEQAAYNRVWAEFRRILPFMGVCLEEIDCNSDGYPEVKVSLVDEDKFDAFYKRNSLLATDEQFPACGLPGLVKALAGWGEDVIEIVGPEVHAKILKDLL